MWLELLQSGGISPDLSAGTLAVPFTRSFLLLHTGISHRLFLKLRVCSGSSWDSAMFCFFFSHIFHRLLLIFFATRLRFCTDTTHSVSILQSLSCFLINALNLWVQDHDNPLAFSSLNLISFHFCFILSPFSISDKVGFLYIASALAVTLPLNFGTCSTTSPTWSNLTWFNLLTQHLATASYFFHSHCCSVFWKWLDWGSLTGATLRRWVVLQLCSLWFRRSKGYESPSLP